MGINGPYKYDLRNIEWAQNIRSDQIEDSRPARRPQGSRSILPLIVGDIAPFVMFQVINIPRRGGDFLIAIHSGACWWGVVNNISLCTFRGEDE